MIIETCRIITDWLNDGTNGVNALLASTPLDGSDTVPPNLVTIADATRSGDAARGRLPATLPGISVMPMPIENLAPHVMIIDAEADVQLAIRLGLSKTATEVGFQQTSYYLRTIIRSLRRFNGNQSNTIRTRNQICIQECSQLRAVQLWETVDDSIITGAIVGTWHVRDLLPT